MRISDWVQTCALPISWADARPRVARSCLSAQACRITRRAAAHGRTVVSKGGSLPLLAFSRFGAGVANMVYAGSLPVLIEAWRMTGVEAGSIQATFNLCYAISLLLCSWASDHVGARRVFVAANWLSALAFLALALFAR